MRLGDRKSGYRTRFIDSSSEEVLLEIVADEDGCSLVAYRLYDHEGTLVADSPEPRPFPLGLLVKSLEDEILLEIPPGEHGRLSYSLYGRHGRLLTSSDGFRTQIFGSLRMDGKAAAGRPPIH